MKKLQEKVKNYFLEMRVNQWIKNVLIFAPLFFSWNLTHSNLYFPLFLGFISFSFFASSIYIINDIFDREQDSMHPIKKYRPIAAWKIMLFEAYILLVILLLLWVLFSMWNNYWLLVILLFYFVFNFLYSIKLKHIPVWDICSVSIMYYLRVLFGAVLIWVQVSPLLFVTIFFWSMFLITAKRYAELISVTEKKRKVLNFYNDKILFAVFILWMVISLMSYILYSFEKGGIYFYSIFFVLYVYIRYIYIVFWENRGEEPENVLISDIGIVLSIVWWLLLSLYMFYF